MTMSAGMKPHNRRGPISLLPVLVSITLPVVAKTFTVGDYQVTINPDAPTVIQLLTMNIEGSGCGAATQLNRQNIDEAQAVIDISVQTFTTGFLCPPKSPLELTLGPLSRAATYRINLYDEQVDDTSGFSPDLLGGSFDFEVLPRGTERYRPEVPQAGSIQSGIGLIRGWTCDAQHIEVQFDELPPQKIAYGTMRTDTFGRCGDNSNGYGAVFAWGTLGQGVHRMRTYIDSVLVDDIEFEVAGLDEPFVRGLTGTYELEDFPAPGESVLVRWSEADQNFIIIQHNK